MIAMNGMIAIASPYCIFHPVRNQSTLANLRIALTTPIRAPPAMKPDAMRVPFSTLLLFTSSSLLRLLTNHCTAPPIIKGIFNCKGMNIPNAKASTGTPNRFSINANTKVFFD